MVVKEKDGMMFPRTASILKDPNVFIGDTGATSDTTNSRYGFTNIKKATKGDNIVDASGRDIAGSMVGDLKVTVCNKNGQELVPV